MTVKKKWTKIPISLFQFNYIIPKLNRYDIFFSSFGIPNNQKRKKKFQKISKKFKKEELTVRLLCKKKFNFLK